MKNFSLVLDSPNWALNNPALDGNHDGNVNETIKLIAEDKRST